MVRSSQAFQKPGPFSTTNAFLNSYQDEVGIWFLCALQEKYNEPSLVLIEL